jgi:hypothetical protein
MKLIMTDRRINSFSRTSLSQLITSTDTQLVPVSVEESVEIVLKE